MIFGVYELNLTYKFLSKNATDIYKVNINMTYDCDKITLYGFDITNSIDLVYTVSNAIFVNSYTSQNNSYASDTNNTKYCGETLYQIMPYSSVVPSFVTVAEDDSDALYSKAVISIYTTSLDDVNPNYSLLIRSYLADYTDRYIDQPLAIEVVDPCISATITLGAIPT